jgi:hypothetical protein
MPASHFDVNSMTGRPKFIVRHSTIYHRTEYRNIFCTHSLESDASNIQRSLSNECFPIDSNVKIAKNTGPLRHSKKKIDLDNNKI